MRLPLLCTILVFRFTVLSAANNLSCYQCVRPDNSECGPETLLPCASNRDRCVTHVSKDATNGYALKRECGLGPCSFEDDMITRGLGIFGACDTSRDEFFCLSCCRTSGCNKALGAALLPSAGVLASALLALLALLAKAL